MAEERDPDVEYRRESMHLPGERADNVGRRGITAAVSNGKQGWLTHAVAARSSRNRTTSPTTTTAGGLTPAVSASAAISRKVEVSTS